ncbi:unnamed protein product [Lampetra fluviatilis]
MNPVTWLLLLLVAGGCISGRARAALHKLLPPVLVKAPLGGNATLRCSLPVEVASLSLSLVRWREPLTKDTVYIYTASVNQTRAKYDYIVPMVDIGRGESSLLLLGVAHSMAGVYQCQLDTEGIDYYLQDVLLEVVGGLCEEQPLTTRVEVSAGHSQRLPCSVSGAVPQIERRSLIMRWDVHLDNGSNFVVSPLSQGERWEGLPSWLRFGGDLQAGDATLGLPGASATHSGLYSCTLTATTAASGTTGGTGRTAATGATGAECRRSYRLSVVGGKTEPHGDGGGGGGGGAALDVWTGNHVTFRCPLPTGGRGGGGAERAMWRGRLENGSTLMISGANANQHGATFTLNSSAHSASLSFERASPSHSGLYSCCVRHGAAANGAPTAAANPAPTAATNGAPSDAANPAPTFATTATNPAATFAANAAATSATAVATTAVVEQQLDPQQEEEDCSCSFRLHVEEPASSSAHQQSDESTPNVTTFLAVICSLLAGVGIVTALLFVLLRRYRNCCSTRRGNDSNQTAKLIRRQKPVLKTILSRDVSFFLDALDRRDFITRRTYNRAKDVPVQEDRANFILDHFIDRGETECQNLLSVLNEIQTHYPLLKECCGDSVTFFQILYELNLSHCYGDKMQRHDVVTLSRRRKHLSSLEEVARHFVQDVMMTNPESRSASTACAARRASSASASDKISDGFINPLDLEVAVLLCADHPLQDDLMHKMSACRFALPLLLPDAGRGVVTLKLCAVRHVARRWRGWQIATRRTGWRDARGEGRPPALVLRMPCVAFARFGRGGSGSKSELLNLILGGRGHEAFVHRDTAQGDVPRVVSDGLVEMSPYFPGAEVDDAEEDDARSPFCALNLRGNAANSRLERQFGFLRAASVATFVFVGSDVVRDSAKRCRALLASAATPVFLLTDFEDGENAESAVSAILSTLPGTMVANVNRRGQNKASFASRLRSRIAILLANTRTAGSTPAEMERLARERGIEVDGWPSSTAADEVVSEVADLGVALYKRERLPRQGDKRPSRPGRRDDPRLGVRASGARIAAPTFLRRLLEKPADDPAAFLRRLAIELDERSAVVLSLALAGGGEAARAWDNCLGVEHFLREVARAYEAAYEAARGIDGGVEGGVLGDDDAVWRTPEIGARLLLSGSLLELVDVDAGVVPAKWLADVLGAADRQLGGGDPTVFVLSALGPHRAETFALLNTTLGSRFPAGGGAGGGAARGVFAALVAVEGGGDAAATPGYVLAVSVEGLASPGPASRERDGELVAFAIAVSHVALVILEGDTGGGDALEGDVVRALLRTGGGQRKEAACIFVCQNSGGVSACVEKARERALLERLAAVSLAGKEGQEATHGRLADVVGHSENYFYLPGPWHGTPPMAAVSAEYVQGVRHLRSRLMERVKRVAAPGRVRLSTLARLVEQAWNDAKREGVLSTDADGS